MAGLALEQTVTLSHSITPDCCGIMFWVTEGQIRSWKRTHKTFYCPGCGGARHYPAESDTERLQRLQREAEARTQRALEEANQLRFSLRSQKAATTRIKNRVGKGVCPCCDRSFQNLARHMASKHPNYGED